jgi:hypothetical protein
MIFLADARGVGYGVLEGAFWIAAALFTGGFFVLSYALAIAPRTDFESWMHMVELTIRAYLLERTAVEIKEDDDFQPGLPASFPLLRAGFIKRHHALSLAKGNSFTRASGPGFVYLFRGENVQNVVELRQQQRRYPVEATTRDGIPVQCSVSITFQIRTRPDPDPDAVFPYDPQGVFQLTYNEKRDAEQEAISREAQIAEHAVNQLAYQIARYKLDTLLETNRDEHTARDIIRHNLQRHLQRQFENEGIIIIRAAMGGIQLPEKVRQQREDAWLATWEQKIRSKQTIGNAEAIRQVKQARARAQIKIIDNIIQNIEAMRQENDGTIELKKIILLRIMEALEDAAGDDSIKGLLPQQIVGGLVDEALSQIQGWLYPDEAQSEVAP